MNTQTQALVRIITLLFQLLLLILLSSNTHIYTDKTAVESK